MQCYKQIVIIQDGKSYLVPCQRCNFCLANRRNDWAFRLHEEKKVSQSAEFITLTYDNQHIPLTWEDDMPVDVTGDKKHLANFHQTIKRSQKRLLKKNYQEWKIRYYSVLEYGSRTGRPHYHSIMFNIHPETRDKLLNGMIWDKGHIYTGTVTSQSINYVAKYVIDKDRIFADEWPKDKVKPFSVMSRNPGIGANYLETNSEWHRCVEDYFNHEKFRIYAIKDGNKVRLPRYYKDKIFKNINGFNSHYEDVLKTSLELYNMEISEEFEKTYLAEIEKLEMTYGDPFTAIEKYNEFRKHKHDQIKIKSLKLNSL